MVVTFSVIGFLVLGLIYFVVRNQALQRELNQIKYALKALDSQSKFSLNALVMLSGHMQRSYLSKLEGLQKSALISNEDYELANFIMQQVEMVIMQCCEHNATVEEAINKAVSASPYNIEQINQFISKQPSEVRIAWCKNTVGGFIAACHQMTTIKKAPSKAITSSPEATQDKAS